MEALEEVTLSLSGADWRCLTAYMERAALTPARDGEWAERVYIALCKARGLEPCPLYENEELSGC